MSEPPPVSPGLPAAPPPTPDAAAPVHPPAEWAAPSPRSEGRSAFERLVVVASLIPLGFALFLQLIAPGFMQPLLDSRAAILGLPPVVGLIVLLLGLVAIDLLTLKFVRSTLAVGVVVVVTTTIGLCAVILAPAIVLIMINTAA